MPRTGIAGNLELEILFAPTTEYFSIMGYVATDPVAQPSLFTALEEELVSAETPSEN
jgi:hypothetical protein